MTGQRAAILRALVAVFPPGVSVAVVGIGDDHPPPLPAELRALGPVMAARRDEFAAGRAAVRRAMAALGQPDRAILPGIDRAPVWPEGLSGSIAHAGGWAVAAVRQGAPLGVDIERAGAVTPDLWPLIGGAEDRPGPDGADAATRLFAAKESLFKAQYPLTRALIGYDAVAVRLWRDRFTARFLRPVGPFAAGQGMQGRCLRAAGLSVAGVAA